MKSGLHRTDQAFSKSDKLTSDNRIDCPARRLTALFALFAVIAGGASAQDTFDPSWYVPSQPYIKLGTTTDQIYSVSVDELANRGLPTSTLDPQTLQLFRNGVEVPLMLATSVEGQLSAGDLVAFVGTRNDGEDEDYLYNENESLRSSRYHSLFTDTTYFWLTWGASSGLRYEAPAPPAAPVPLTSFTTMKRHEQENVYFRGDGISLGSPLYTDREGYYWARVAHNTSTSPITREYDAPIEGWSSQNTDTATVRVRLSSETTSQHEVTLALRLFNGSSNTFEQVDTLAWTGLSLQTLEARIAQDRLPTDGILRVRLTSRNDFNSAIPNNWYLDWVDVSYTRRLAAESGTLELRVQTAGDFSATIDGLSGDSALVLSPDLGEGIFSPIDGSGATSLAWSAPANTRYFVADLFALATPTITLDTPSDLASTTNTASYVLIRPDGLRQSAARLADYRRSVAGGGHTVADVPLQDIFDQFDYGRPTPIAIRRFLRHSQTWQEAPAFVVMWGDALYPDKKRPRQDWELISFGNTASDGWFAMQTAGLQDYSEFVAIGRIPLRTEADGDLFVDKISGYEQAAFERWQKNALFLVGGTTDIERNLLRASALDWSGIVSGLPTTLDTTHFFKVSSEALDPTFKESIQEALREGTSWVTYFGHSAAQTWEIVTDPPADYDNAGRLPMVLSLGCFTGDFATGSGDPSDLRSFSEQLVLDNLGGGIGHWGASSSGTIGASAALSDEVHHSVFVDSLRILGQALREAKVRFAARFLDPLSIKHLLQYGLIGDPATRLTLPTKPDFVSSESRISITPIAPIAADSNLVADVRLENYGLAPADSVIVRVTRTRPDRSTDVIDRLVPPFGLERQETFVLPIDETAVGEHTVRVDIDPDMRYTEEDEMNNTGVRTTNVFAIGVSLLEPPESGLVPTTDPELRVVVSRREAGDVPVVFQLSPSPDFSPLSVTEFRATTPGLTATWRPTGLQADSTYYWRARVDDGSDPVWQMRAFTVRPDFARTGWHQTDRLFEDNDGDSYLQWTDGRWELRDFELDVSAAGDRGGGIWRGQFVVAGERFERLTLGFGLLVIDGTTGSVKSHTSAATYPNDFFDPVAGYDSLVAHASRVVDGDYIFTRTRHLGNKDGLVQIADSVKSIFRTLGSTAIDTLTYRDLWIMFTRFGLPGETVEWVEPSGNGVNEILRDTTLTFSFGSGTTVTPPIGPAQDWYSLTWNAATAHPDNRFRLDVLDAESNAILVGNLQVPGSADLSGIDPTIHPFVRLRAQLKDTTNLGTPQLLDWSMEYEPVAELALHPLTSVVSADTLQEGDTIELTVDVANLSSVDSGRSIVDYFATDAANKRRLVTTDTLSVLAADATATVNLFLETRGEAGENVLEARLRQEEFPDPITHNNILVWPATVERDQIPPQLEVLVDGESFVPDPNPVVNLQDPAIPFVKLHPNIEIIVNDENEFIPLRDDTTVVRVHLDGVEVPFSELSMSSGKRAGERIRLLYQPRLPERDTVHTLVVEAFDGTGNAAADNPYQVHFRTQTDVQVESVYPYPNPMSTSTVFAFRLRGADTFTIDDFRIRIYTINGRLIREFDLIQDPSVLETGGLRIGWNKLRWDGTDQDGDLVATGVYLYKVFASEEEGSIDLGSTRKVERIAVIR